MNPSVQQLSFPTLKDIVNNETDVIIVTHVNSPSDFYLQLVKNESIMRMITIDLHQFVETQLHALHNIEMGELPLGKLPKTIWAYYSSGGN